MVVSSKVRYATQALIHLAHHGGAGPMSVREIGRREELSDKYLESVLAQLKAAGLVASRKGKHGGYVLGRAADQITLLDVVDVFDAGIVLERESEHSDTPAWTAVRDGVEAILRKMTIADAARSAREQRRALDYTI